MAIMEQRMAVDMWAGVPDGFGEALAAHVTVDEHGIVTAWNAGAAQLLGYTPPEILGRCAAELLAEEVAGEQLRRVADLPRWNGTITLRRKDSRRLRARVLAHHRTPDTGTGDWLVVSALTGALPRPGDDTLVSRSFVQSTDRMMAIYDTGLRVRRANEALQRAVGLSEEDLIGLRLSEYLQDPQMDKVERHMLRAVETGEPQYLEVYLRAPGESREHAWSVALSPLKGMDGEVLGVCGSTRDMTDQYWARKRLALIAAAGDRIGSTLDVTRTSQELADVAVPELADFVSVDLLASLDDSRDPGPAAMARSGLVMLRRIAHQSVLRGVPEAVVTLGTATAYPQGSPPAEALASGHAGLYRVTDYAIIDWTLRDDIRKASIREFGMHSMMTVPLSARGTTLGVAVFIRHRHPDGFEQDDLVLAEELTARAAVCIDNALRYTRERRTAVTLQRNLLPQRLPEQTAVEVASRYLPAGANAGVGGDWFDVIPLSGARTALVVGDVVGHGVHASATMGRLRTAVRTLADVELPPDELLTHLDDLVAHLSTEVEDAEWTGRTSGTAGDVGATCVYAVYDPVSRHLVAARAGHPQPAVVTPDGTVELLDLPSGPPLGVGGLPFEAADVELPAGSLLALYTDGLVESREQDIGDGLSLLLRALAEPATSLDDLCDTVLASTAPARQADDIALLIARTRGLDAWQVATWEVPADPSAVASARKEAARQVADWGLDDAVFVTELVVSELVTNAIRHGEPPVQLRLIRDKDLICEVSDASGTAPHMRRARTYDEGGRGLLLVAQMTRRWGTRQTDKGKIIWAEQALSATPAGSASHPS
jgi:PAS domain S-box-containing protein